MKKGVQQMMLGTLCPDLNRTKEVLKAIKDAGYDGIEMNQYMIHPTSFFVRGLTKAAGMPSGNLGKYDWPSLLKEAGLEAIALHSDPDSLEHRFDKTLEDARSLNVDTIVITGVYNYPYHKKEKVDELIARLNASGARLAENGLKLLYHNHNVEYTRLEDGKTVYDRMIRKLDRDLVNFELDAYWTADAGKDPVRMMKKLSDRVKLFHVTDRGVRIRRTPITPILHYDSVELGTGNLDLERLFTEAEKLDIPYVILESHKNWIHDSALESIQLSGRYLNEKVKAL